MSIDGTSLISSEDGVKGVNFLVLCGEKEVDIRADKGFGGTTEDGVAATPGVFMVLFVMDGKALRVVLVAGVGMVKPSPSTCGVSVFVSVSSSFVSGVGV